jgi:polysaccharide pyruvyl transferase WcaK-like protein
VSRHVLLAGAFGQGNPGDEALLTAFAAALPGHRPIAISSAPATTSATHGIATVHRDDARAVWRAIRRSDAIVVAGGTVFKLLHPACGRRPGALLRRLAALTIAAKALRKPVALVGVGAADLGSYGARHLSRAVVEAADLLILRDEESATQLAAAGATTPFRVGADAAWTILDERAPSVADGPAAPVVVALSHLAGGEELADRLVAGLAPVAAAGFPVLLQPWQLEDVALARALAARLEGAAIVAAPTDLTAARDALAGARLVVGLRFHALVAAAVAGVPFVAYAHEPKHLGLARRLRQAAVIPGGPLSDTLMAALDLAPPSLDAVAHERWLAAEGFRLLRVLVAGGRTEEAAAVDGLDLRPEEWLV